MGCPTSTFLRAYGGRAQAGLGIGGFGGLPTLEAATRCVFDLLPSLSLGRLRLAAFVSGGLHTLGDVTLNFFDCTPSILAERLRLGAFDDLADFTLNFFDGTLSVFMGQRRLVACADVVGII